jgi:hypothetical protein
VGFWELLGVNCISFLMSFENCDETYVNAVSLTQFLISFSSFFGLQIQTHAVSGKSAVGTLRTFAADWNRVTDR